MARQATIKNETILKAAREVFLERGSAAPTSVVAKRAGVSEGTIFNRFETKENLFKLAMLPTGEDLEWMDELLTQAGQGDLEQNLKAFGGRAITFFRELLPLMMMMWSRPDCRELHTHMMRQPKPPPVIAIGRLTRFFQKEMELGRLRDADPRILARMFMSGLAQYVFFEAMHAGNVNFHVETESYVSGLIDVFLHGASAHNP